jgi:3'(2'), 5'-bisphosphate nucleotidase
MTSDLTAPETGTVQPELSVILTIACDAARRAGSAIMEIYTGDFAVSRKADASPVTEADEQAEAIIVAILAAATPGIPVIAEELAARHGLPESAPERFWLVDPLDGTKEFVARNGEFTVNIALVEGDRPVLGIIHVPVTGDTYHAIGPGTATWEPAEGGRIRLAARCVPEEGLIVLHSRSHANHPVLDSYLARLKVAERRVSGSSVKFCLLAAGQGDIYPRFGETMEWDTAAGQAILESAGGTVTTLAGDRLRYGKPGFINPGFIARGRGDAIMPSERPV